jgi:uncharacterized iron-regulated membrane protein
MDDGPVSEGAAAGAPPSQSGRPADTSDVLTSTETTDHSEASATGVELDPTDVEGRSGRLRPVLYRLHFFGGFFAAPIALWLALTGILFAWNPQIESWIFGDERNATADGDLLPLSDQIDAVQEAYPDYDVTDVTPADEAGEATGVFLQPTGAEPTADFSPVAGSLTAYIDPVDARMLGSMGESSRPDEVIRNLHSNFKLGTRIGTLTELAASWVLISLLTGLYLWWPKTRQALRRTFTPRLRGLRTAGRRQWKDLHSSIGVIILVLLAGMVATGLTWTEYAGRWVDVAKDAVSAQPVSLNTELEGGEGAGGGEHHEGGEDAEAAFAPEFGDIDAVVATASDADLSYPYTITPPGGPGQAWQVAEVDDRWPIQVSTIAVDPASGDVIDRTETGDQAMIDQLTSAGIGFHSGTLFGLANQILLTLLALGVIALLVTGYIMWWKRRPQGAFGPPPKFGPILRNVPIWVIVAFVALMVLLPTMGVAFVIYLVLERLFWLARGRPSPPNRSTPTTPSAPSASAV